MGAAWEVGDGWGRVGSQSRSRGSPEGTAKPAASCAALGAPSRGNSGLLPLTGPVVLPGVGVGLEVQNLHLRARAPGKRCYFFAPYNSLRQKACWPAHSVGPQAAALGWCNGMRQAARAVQSSVKCRQGGQAGPATHMGPHAHLQDVARLRTADLQPAKPKGGR